jgi:antitoxin CptB
MTQLPSASKLAWMCRRGLLELDLILRTIREERYTQLSDEEKALFCDFLDTPDNELLAYLLGQEQVDAAEYPDLSSLISKICIKK